MGSPRCSWVRDRLPLLVGDDLRGPDRRRVERHLIGCPSCRQHQAALGQALAVLQTVAVDTPAPADAPSLWPALARQIRESRRPVASSTGPLAPALVWLRRNPRPALSFGLGLGLLAALGIGLGVRQQTAAALAHIAANERPIAASEAEGEAEAETEAVPTPGLGSGPRLTQLPASSSRAKAKTKVRTRPRRERELPALIEVPVVENPPPRIDYDLEHLRPMPDPRDARDTKATY